MFLLNVPGSTPSIQITSDTNTNTDITFFICFIIVIGIIFFIITIIAILAKNFSKDADDNPSKKPANEGELLENVIIFHRDGKTVKKQFTKEQMEMITKMLDAIPEKPKDI